METSIIKTLIDTLANPQTSALGVAALVVLCIMYFQFKKLRRTDGALTAVDTSYQGIVAMLEKQHAQCQADRRQDKAECDAQMAKMIKRIETLEAAK